jgi:peptidoglycan-associated lipoprotein
VLKEEKSAAMESAAAVEAAKPAEKAAAESAAAVEAAKAAKKATSVKKAKESAEAKAAATAASDLKSKEKAAAVAAKDLYELADINFDYDNFRLRDEARGILNKHADWLNRNKDVMLAVEGHCDERGTAEYNLALGERRANAATKFLIDNGVDAKRIKTVSYGEELPLDPGHNEEAWAKNRRAHFVASGKK